MLRQAGIEIEDLFEENRQLSLFDSFEGEIIDLDGSENIVVLEPTLAAA
jgi:hypothetical protein